MRSFFIGMKSAGKLTSYWPLAAMLALHVVLQWNHLQLDFWNDELYTLERFVCQPFGTAAVDYRSTNNHVFFSLMAQCWTRLVGIRSYADAVTHPFTLRLLPLLCSSLAIYWTYKIGEKLGGRGAGLIAGVILVTSIPFWNYGAQMRGYGLSMALYAGLGNAIIVALSDLRLLRLLPLSLFSLLLLYTVPSNAYFLTAAIAIVLLFGKAKRTSLLIVAVLAAGGTFAILLYLPLLPQMQRLPIFSAGTATQSFEALRERFPVVSYHFLSARYLLLALIAAFLVLERRQRWTWIGCIAIITLLPFLLADARGNSTPYRVFLTGLPGIAAGMGIAINTLTVRIRAKTWRYAFFLATAAYCLATFFFQSKKTEAVALRDIATGQRSGDLYFQYNLHFFQPRTDANAYMQTYARPDILLVERCRMDAELLKYLSLAGWDRAAAKGLSLDSLLFHRQTVDVLAETPAVLRKALSGSEEAFISSRQLLNGPRPVQIFRLTIKH